MRKVTGTLTTWRGKLFILALGMMSVLLLVAACGGNSEASPGEVTPPPEAVIVESVGSPPLPVVTVGLESSSLNQAGGTVQYNTNQQVGIWVTGRGEVTTTPDLFILEAGVEARAISVAEAHGEAARAMDRISEILKNRGIEDKDIQTRFFNISPEYVWNDSKRRQELVGYMVTNQATVKIRDLDSVGLVIDEVATAAGDLVRIQGIRFTVENTEELESQARAKAVENLTAKAAQFAQLTGVNLGRLVFLSESGGFTPSPVRIERAFAEAAPAPAFDRSTSISAGELKLAVSLQGVFAID